MSVEGKYVNLIIDISHEKLDRTFQYKIPGHLLGKIQIGMVVQVPFGKGGKIRKGYVMEVTNRALVEEERMKWVEGIAPHSPVVEERFIQLAAWMREHYGSTMAAALKVVLPVKKTIKPKEKKEIHLLYCMEEAKEKLFFFMKKKQTARARLLEA
ncbi:primosomal protein N', partial [bacterium 1XD42-8]